MENNNTQKILVRIVGSTLIIGVIIVGVIFVLDINSKVGNPIPIKVVVNPPKPRLMESHSSEDESSTVFHYRQGVFATVLNEGGDGKVLVKVVLKQKRMYGDGENTYQRSEDAFIGANQTKDFHFVFTEPVRIGGDISYEVTAVSME